MDRYIELLAKEENLKNIFSKIQDNYILHLKLAAHNNILTELAADKEEKKRYDKEFYAHFQVAQALIDLIDYKDIWEDFAAIKEKEEKFLLNLAKNIWQKPLPVSQQQ